MKHTPTIMYSQRLAAEALKLKCQASDLVNLAYGVTPEEITPMWQTASPRMPISAPKAQTDSNSQPANSHDPRTIL